jgi:hypothetical protein
VRQTARSLNEQKFFFFFSSFQIILSQQQTLEGGEGEILISFFFSLDR